jgi:hypothetical protein
MCRGHLDLFNDFDNSRYIDGTSNIEDHLFKGVFKLKFNRDVLTGSA